MKKLYFKKAMSLFMAVMMILSCWVWVPGEHNHASAAGADANYINSLLSGISFNNNVTTITDLNWAYNGDNQDNEPNVYKNILYSSDCNVATASTGSVNLKDSGAATIEWYHGATTFLYDDVTTPQTGVMVCIKPKGSSYNVRTYSSYINEGEGLDLAHYWYASDSRANFMWVISAPGNTVAATHDGSVNGTNAWTVNSNTWLANKLQYTGSMTDSEFYKDITVTWGWKGNQKSQGTGNVYTYTATSGNHIYVINWKTLKAAYANAQNYINSVTADPGRYSLESVRELAEICEALVAAHPNNYVNASENDPSGYATAASAAVAKLNAFTLEDRTYDITYENLFSLSDWVNSSSTTMTGGTLSYDISAGTITTTDAAGGNPYCYTSYTGNGMYKIPVGSSSADRVFVFESDIELLTSTGASYVIAFNADTGAKISDEWQTSAGKMKKEFTVPAGCSNITVRFGTAGGVQQASVKYSNIAIYEQSRGNEIGIDGWTTRPYRTVYNYGTVFTTASLSTPVRPGYQFEGWYLEPTYITPFSNYNNAFNFTTTNNAANFPAYSKWTGLPQTLSVDTNGGLNSGNLIYNPQGLSSFSGGSTSSISYNGTIDEYGVDISGEYTTNTNSVEATVQLPLWVYLEEGKTYEFSFTSTNNFSQFYFFRGNEENTSSGATGGKHVATNKDIGKNMGTYYQYTGTFTGGGTESCLTDTNWTSATSNGYADTTAFYQLRLDQDYGDVTESTSGNKYNIQNFIIREVSPDATSKYVQPTGTTYTIPAPTKDGYTFNGWTVDSTTTAAGDYEYTFAAGGDTIVANWVENSYTVTFKDWDGTVLSTQTVKYNNAATAPADPTRNYDETNHYAFAGWDADFADVTANITVTATYTTTPHNKQYTTATAGAEDNNGNIIGTHTVSCSGCSWIESANCVMTEDAAQYVAPNCATNGKRVYVCSDCGNTYTKVLAATGVHNYADDGWYCVDGTNHRRDCTNGDANCTAYEISGHEYSDTDWTDDGETNHAHECTVCKGDESKKTEVHSFSEWTETKAANCVTAGEEERTCSKCGRTETQAIPATGVHAYGDWAQYNNGTTHRRTCANCSAYEEGDHEFGGDAVRYDESYHWYACIVCKTAFGLNDTMNSKEACYGNGVTYTEIAGDLNNHTAECVCGNTKTVAHNWVEDTAKRVDATCTQAGTAYYNCPDCSAAKEETLPMAAHNYEYVSDENATCLQDGTKTGTCTECGATETVTDEGSQLDHNYTNPTIVRPTQNDDGTWTEGQYIYTCSNGCNGTKTEPAPRADYSELEAVVAELETLKENDKLSEDALLEIADALAKADALADNLVTSEQPQIDAVVDDLLKAKALVEDFLANVGLPQHITEPISGLKVQFLKKTGVDPIDSVQLNSAGGFDTARIKLTNNNKDLPITVTRIESDKSTTYIDTSSSPSSTSITTATEIAVDGSKDIYIGAPASFKESGIITYTITYNIGSEATGYLMNADGTPVELQTKAYLYVKAAAYQPYHIMDEEAGGWFTATSKWQHYVEAVNYGDFTKNSETTASKFSEYLEAEKSSTYVNATYDYEENGCFAECTDGNYVTGDAHAATYNYFVDTSLAPTWEAAGFRVRFTESATSVYEHGQINYVRMAVDQKYLNGISGDDKTFTVTFVPSSTSNVPDKTWEMTSTGTLEVSQYTNGNRGEYLFGEHKNKDGFDETSAYANFSGTIPAGVTEAKLMFSPRLELSGFASTESVTMTTHIWLTSYDKGALRTAVNAAEQAAYNRDYYNSAKWDAYNTALKNAKEILGKAETTQAEVDSVLAALNTAVSELTDSANRAKYVLTVTDSIHESADKVSDATSTLTRYYLIAKGTEFTAPHNSKATSLTTINKYDDTSAVTVNGTSTKEYHYWYIDYTKVQPAIDAANAVLNDETKTYSEEYLNNVETARDALQTILDGKDVKATPEKQFTVEEAIKAVTDLIEHTCEYDSVVTDPTCTTDGFTTYTCKLCGNGYTTVGEGKLGHNFTQETATEEYLKTEATCTDAAVYYKSCTRCGLTSKDTEYEATFSHGVALGHSFVNYVSNNNATCTEDGTETATCIRCTETDTRTDADSKLGHNMDKTEKKDPTCTEDGNIEYYTCKRCGKLYLDEKGATETSAKDIVVSKTGHTYKYASTNNGSHIVSCEKCSYSATETCYDTDGDSNCNCDKCGYEMAHKWSAWSEVDENNHTRTCSECSKVETLAHTSFTLKVTAPTCTEQGYTTHTCDDCGYSYKDTYTDALGHSVETWSKADESNHSGECTVCHETITEEHKGGTATCTEAKKCTVCNGYYGDALGHTTTHTVANPANCEDDGNHEYWYCSRCDKYFADEDCTVEKTLEELTIEALDHNFGEYVSDGNATCTTDGTKTAKCTRCDVTVTITDVGSSLGHNFTGDPVSATTKTHSFKCVNKDCTAVGTMDDGTAKLNGAVECVFTNKYEKLNADNHTAFCVCGNTVTESHAWNEGTLNPDSTCTSEGNKDFECTKCGETKQETVEKKAHKLTETPAVEETCLTDGNIQYWTCSECGKIFKDKDAETEINAADTVIAKIGHKNKEYHEKVDATCTVNGTIEYWYCPDCDKYFTNEECTAEAETIVITAPGHTAGTPVIENEVDPDCENAGSYDTVIYCTVCKTELSRVKTTVAALGHDYDTDNDGDVDEDDGVVTTEPKCETDGVRTYTCKNDASHTYTEVVPQLGHIDENPEDGACDRCHEDICEHKTTVETERKESTCLAEGNIQYWTCQVCKKNFSDEECKTVVTDEKIVIAKKPHDYSGAFKDNGDKTHSFLCVNGCNEYGEAIPCMDSTTDKDCNCDVCGGFVAHTPAQAVVEDKVEATCGTDGSYNSVIYCSVCNDKLSTTKETIPATGKHTYGDFVHDEGKDTHTKTCEVCGHTVTETCVASDWIIDKTATCIAEGSKYKKCTVCNHEMERASIPMIAHNFSGTATTAGKDVHDYQCQNVIDGEKCTVRGAVVNGVHTAGATEECSGGTASCTALAVCAKCNTEYGELKAHTFTIESKTDKDKNSTLIREADCENDSLYYLTCSACQVSAEGIDETATWTDAKASGHNFTGTINALADGKHNFKCMNCDAYGIVADGVQLKGESVNCEYTAKYTYKDATHHTAFCECGNTEDVAHTESTEATCTAPAYCDVCKHSYGDKLGHNMGVWTTVTEATCTVDGEERRDCSRCDYFETQAITAPGHKYIDHEAKTPTCEDIGWEAYQTCSECDYTSYKELNKLGHAYDYANGDLTRPTENADGTWSQGYYTYTCANDPSHKDVKYVDRADYSDYDEVVKDLNELLGTDITEEAKNAINEALSNNDIADDRINEEQNEVDDAANALEVIYAKYQNSLNSYTVEFVVEGTVISTQTVVSGKDANAPTVGLNKAPDAEYHYSFSKWDKGYTDVESDLTVTAEFTGEKHYGGTATCSVKAECSVCGSKYGELDTDNHEFTTYITNNDATCLADGTETATCNWCKTATHTRTDADSKKPHSYTGAVKSNGNGEDGTHSFLCVNGCKEYGGTVKHSWDNGTVTTEPTCEETGIRTFNCTVENCGGTYETEVAAKGHSVVATAEKAATCTAEGNIAYWTCSVCDKVFTDKDATTEITDKNNDGVKNALDAVTEALGHNFTTDVQTKNNGTHDYKCSRCDVRGAVVDGKHEAGKSENCSGGTATCTEKAVCEKCNTEYGSALGHNMVKTDAVDATCTTDGNIAYYTCQRCNKLYLDDKGNNETTADDVVIKAAHKWEDTYTVDKEATCTEDGSESIHCSVCDATKDSRVIGKLNHNEGEWVVTKKASCTENGAKELRCTRVNDGETCGTVIGEATILVRTHVMGEWGYANEADKPTYTTQGTQIRYCQNKETDEYEACTYSETQTVADLDDTTSAEGEIGYQAGAWDKFLNTVTFGIYVNYDVEVEITAEDAETGIDSIEYYVSEDAMTLDELKAHTDWTTYDEANKVTIAKEDTKKYVVYAKIVNGDGDVTYISTDGFTFDTTAPVLTIEAESGNAATKEYCSSVTVKVTEANLAYAIFDGNTTPLGTNGFLCNTVGTHTLQVYDMAGNSTTVTFTINDGHTDGEAVKENYKDSTCSAEGSYDSVVYCTVCGKEVSRTPMTVEKKPHTEGEAVIENNVEPDCENAGSYETVIYCTVCKKELSRVETIVDALGHTEGEAVIENNVEPDCENDGSYETVVYCTVCKKELSRVETIVDALGHTEGEAVIENNVKPDCENNGSYETVVYCTVCKKELSRVETIVDALGHDYKAVVTAPTCTEEGFTTYTCANCGDTYVADYVDALGHDYKAVVTAPTCTEEGFTTHTCANCGDSYVDSYVDATGHAWGDWTVITEADCTVDGVERRVCANDENHIEEHAITAGGHSWGNWITDKEATCTENGEKHRVCYNNEEHIETQVIETAGHDFGNWTTVTEATCETDGEKVRTCLACGETETAVIPATGHDWSAWKVIEGDCESGYTRQRICLNCSEVETESVAAGTHYYLTDENGNEIYDDVVYPTCTQNGYYIYRCDICDGGERRITVETPGYEEELKATGHNFGEWIVTSEPTCFRTGSKYRVCANNCGTTCGLASGSREVVIIPETNHEGGWKQVPGKAATCSEDGYTEYLVCERCGFDQGKQIIAAKGHADENEDGKCDSCKNNIKYSGDCGCLCHATGFFAKFIFKILNFFYKLFRINRICDCGAVHY